MNDDEEKEKPDQRPDGLKIPFIIPLIAIHS